LKRRFETKYSRDLHARGLLRERRHGTRGEPISAQMTQCRLVAPVPEAGFEGGKEHVTIEIGVRGAFERALRIHEQLYGPEHPAVATGVNYLGLVLHDLGALAGGRAAFLVPTLRVGRSGRRSAPFQELQEAERTTGLPHLPNEGQEEPCPEADTRSMTHIPLTS
jgi:hypothetical protein